MLAGIEAKWLRKGAVWHTRSETSAETELDDTSLVPS